MNNLHFFINFIKKNEIFKKCKKFKNHQQIIYLTKTINRENLMKKTRTKFIKGIIIMLLTSVTSVLLAQTKITGNIKDAGNKETLAGVNIAVKGKVIGTTTDVNGNFSLSTNTPTPFTLSISYVGYQTQEVIINADKVINISLEEQAIMGQEVVIAASRIEESVLKSSASIEKMDIRSIQQAAAPTFYDALANMKGVEMSSQSLTFKSVNTRGFNANGNVRMVQLIDGMDNQAPGLNFAVGNIVGMSELDVESVELLPGAASALYGPNAINGILLMNSKSPFLYQGLSASVKAGMMHFGDPSGLKPSAFTDFNVRYAKAFNNKIAFKLNFGNIQAQDWTASNSLDLNANLNPNSTRQTNPNYNGVNVYGDETSANIKDVANAMVARGLIPAAAVGLVPSVSVSRTGYKEQEITTPQTKNMKFNASLHYRVTEKVELIAQANYGFGNTVYTGADRYSIKNFSIGQYKLEAKGDNFFLRGYTTQERSGDSFASGTLGQLINEGWGSGSAIGSAGYWYPTYVGAFIQAKSGGLGDAAAHNAARGFADTNRPAPGSAAYNAIADKLKKIDIPNGAHFNDKSNLYHYEGMFNFKNQIKFAELIVGASQQTYQLNSGGTIFADKDGRKININEIGAYAQIAKQFGSILKLSSSLRYDKSTNFDGQYTPRISGVFTFADNHNIRLSYQTAFRIPTTQNQYIDLKVPQARLIGGLQEFKDKYNLESNAVYSLANVQAYGAAVLGLASTDAVKNQAVAIITDQVKAGVTAQVTANLPAITAGVTAAVTQIVVGKVVEGAVALGAIPNDPTAIAAAIQAGIAGQLPAALQGQINAGVAATVPGAVQAQVTKLITDNVTAVLPGKINENITNVITAIAGAGAKGTLKQYQFRKWVPEKVASYEIGYKAMIAKKLFVDAYYYSNVYKNFSSDARVIQVTPEGATALKGLGVDPVVGLLSPQYRQVYSFPSSSIGKTTSNGWGLGLDYNLSKGFNLGVNVSQNVLKSADQSIIDDGNQISYNTPKYRYNITFGNRNIAKSGIGFNLIFRHQDSFLWNSSFVSTPDPSVSIVPAANVVDFQINKRLPSLKSVVKLGASNLFNKYYITSYGNPSIGGQYYVSLVFDELFNK